MMPCCWLPPHFTIPAPAHRSLPQMEKRCKCDGAAAGERNWGACRDVLQKGLLLNRDAPALLQAWGLMEMQVGVVCCAVLCCAEPQRAGAAAGRG